MEPKELTGVILTHPDLGLHDAATHPDRPNRVTQITDRLMLDGLWVNDVVVEADIAPLKRLKDVHDEDYLNDLHRRCTHGVTWLDPRTPVMEKSFDIARIGAGGVLDAIDLIMADEAANAFCLTAMPGHLAHPDKFVGGCLINYAAVGAHYLTKKYQLGRVAVVHFGVEHALGTESIFLKRKDVLTLSCHEYPAFPGTGHYSDDGKPPALGFAVNVPVPSGYGDRELRLAVGEVIVPVLSQFEPEFLILSWGFDGLRQDPSGHLRMTPFGYIEMLAKILAVARKSCPGRVVSILQAGTPSPELATCVSQHVNLLLNNRVADVDRGEKDELVSYSDWYTYAKVLKGHLRKYWRL